MRGGDHLVHARHDGLLGVIFLLALVALFVIDVGGIVLVTLRFGRLSRLARILVLAVAVGLGVSILPASLRGIAVADVACRDLSPAGVPTSMWLIHRRHDQSPASATFVALATANRQPRTARAR